MPKENSFYLLAIIGDLADMNGSVDIRTKSPSIAEYVSRQSDYIFRCDSWNKDDAMPAKACI